MKAEKSLEWQRLYEKALAERDPEHQPEDIARAEAAIISRLKKVAEDDTAEPERLALRDALIALRELKVRYFPGWK